MGARSFNLTRPYVDDPKNAQDSYPIEFTLSDNNGGSVSQSISAIVTNADPILQSVTLDQEAIDEGGLVTLTGSFTDAGTLDTHTVTIHWGNLVSTQATVDPATRTFTAQYRYVDDGSGGDNGSTKEFEIGVTVTDNDGGQTIDEAAESITVRNVAPQLFDLSLLNSEIDENGTVSVTGSYSDVGLADTHTIIINWGDFTTSQATLVPNPLGGGGTFTASHLYVDDVPAGTAFDTYAVTAEISDDDGATSAPAPVGIVKVNNVRPSDLIVSVDALNAVVAEGGTLLLSASFVDPGTVDYHEVVINWGDGSEETRFGLEIGLRERNDIPHIYAKNRVEPYTITVSVNDDDQRNQPVVTTFLVTVGNAIPQNLQLQLDDLDATIKEGQSVLLSGSFTDSGLNDQHTLVINWGDATPNTIVPNSQLSQVPGQALRTFSGISHTYFDDRPSGTDRDEYTITVTVTDGDFVADLLVASRSDSRVARFDGVTGNFIGDFITDIPESSEDDIGQLGAFVVGPDSNLYVIDSSSPSVLRYNGTTGEFLGQFVAPGNGLTNPQAIAFGPGGVLYLSSGSNEVLRYDGATGAFLGRLVGDDPVTPDDETGGLLEPSGFAFGPNGRLLVSSRGTNQVMRYDRATGQALSPLVTDLASTPDIDESGQLQGPGALVIGPDGRLYVTSRDNHSVLRYDATSGAFLGGFVRDLAATIEDETGGLNAPAGLAFDAQGRLYVSSQNGTVLQYAKDNGAFIKEFSSGGSLANPGRVAFLTHQSSVRTTITVENVAPIVTASSLEVRGLSPYITQDRFLSTTGATPVAAWQNLGLISGGSTASHQSSDNQVTVRLGPEASQLYVGGPTDWTTRLAGAEITTTGKSNLDIELASDAYAFGFDFVEPQSDPNRDGAFVDSVFELRLFAGSTLVGNLTVNRPNDTASFIGVQALTAFNRIEIREISGAEGREFFGQFFIGNAPGLAEGSIATLSGAFTDVSPSDTFTVVVDWGDGSTPTLIPKTAQDRSFTAEHKYLDDIGVPGSPFDVNQITVTVEDDDLGVSDPAATNLTVRNVKPLVFVETGQDSTATQINLRANVSEPGSGPTEVLTHSWTVSESVFNFDTDPPTELISPGASGSGPTFSFAPGSGRITVTLTVSDDDSGSDTDTAVIVVGTNDDDRITIAANGTVTVESFDVGLGSYVLVSTYPVDLITTDRILVFGLDGDDIIHGQTSPLPMVADGGNGADVITLSDGDDTAFLTAGDDTVDLGNGNNVAYLIPNSTLSVKAGTGDNTLNFSLADFGIALDMNQFDGTVQMVAADQFAFTAVAANDTLTAPGHIFQNGKKIRITARDGLPLPAGLTDDGVYEVSDVSGDNFKLKSLAGIAINITSDGEGNVTLEHNVAVDGNFTNLVTTAKDDNIIAATAKFDSLTQTVGRGSIINTGDGNDSILSKSLSGQFDLGAGENVFIQTLDAAELASIGGALDGADLAALTGALDVSVVGGTDRDTIVFGGIKGSFNLGEGDNLFVHTLDGNDLASLTGALDAETLTRAQAAFDGSDLAQLIGSLDSADLATVFGSLDVSFSAGEGVDRVWTSGVGGQFDLGGGDDFFARSLDSSALSELRKSLDSAELATLIGSLDVQVNAGTGADQVITSLRGSFDLGDGADSFTAVFDGMELGSLGGILDSADLAALTGSLDAAALDSLRGVLDSADLVALIGSLDVQVVAGDGNDTITSSLAGSFDLGDGDNIFVGALDIADLAMLGGALDSPDLAALVGSLDVADLVALGGALDGADLAALIGALDVNVFGGSGADQVRSSIRGNYQLGDGDNLFVGLLDTADLATLSGSLDAADLTALVGALDGADLVALGGALDSAELAALIGALDVSVVLGAGNDQVQSALRGDYNLGDGENLFIGSLDTAELAILGGALDSADLVALVGALDGNELAALIGSLDGADLTTTTGALDGADLAALIGALDVNVTGGAQADQVQSALPGVYDLGGGDNLFIGTLDGLELAVLGGALDGADLAYLIGALDGADLVQLGGALDGADLAALIGGADGADLVALGGALDGAELVALGGALDGAELAALIGALDVSVVGTTGNDRVQSKLPGTYDLGAGNNSFIGLLDGAELVALGGALDGMELVRLIGSLDAADLAALVGALDGAELVALGGALDSAELAALIGALDVSVVLGAGNDQVQSALRGDYNLGDGENLFIGSLDTAELAVLGGALDGAELVALVGALDGNELAALIGSLDGADLTTTTGALDGADLAALIGALDVNVTGGAQADQVQSALPGVYDLGAGDNLFIGTLDGLELAVLGGALDGADLAYLIGALDGADLVQLGGALDGADLAALIGALDGADLVALGGALDGAELVALGGALDGAELAALIGALDVSVVGTTGNDRVQSKLPGTYDLGAGNNSFIGLLDGAELVALGGALDGMELVRLIGSLDAADLAALVGALDGAELVALGGALDSAELAALIGALDVSVVLGAGNDQVQSALRGDYNLGDGENLFIGSLDTAELAILGGALDSADLVALVGALDGNELAALIGSLDGADLTTTTGALDGADLAALIGALDVNVTGGAQADQVQSALPGVYDLGAGDNLFIGTLDGLELAVLGGALDGADLAYLIGALDGADLVQLGGALDGADLAALIGALDGADLVALGGALDGAELVALGGALDGAELAALIGALDVSVVGTTGNDRVQSKLPGTYDLGAGNNSFIGLLDGAELVALGGALDGMELVRLIGSLDAADLAALVGALDGAELVALGGALDSAELAALIGALDVSVVLGAGNDQVQSALRGDYNLGDGENLFIGSLDTAELAILGGALDSAELVALVGALDGNELAALIGSLDGADLTTTTGALDGADLAALIGALDVNVTGGAQADQVQSALPGVYDLGAGDNLFIGTLDGLELAVLGGALDGADLAYLIGALDGADLVQLGGALDGADLAALIGALDGADLVALGGALDGAELVALGGALDGAELAALIGALDVSVVGTTGNDRVQSKLPGTYDLGAGNNSFIGLLDGAELVALGGALDGMELVRLIGSLDAADLAALVGALDGAELVALGGALDSAELAALIGALDVSVVLGAGNDQVQSALRGDYNLGDGENLFIGSLDTAELAILGGALDSADLVALVGALDGNELAALIGSLDGADLTTTTGALDGADLAALIGALDVNVTGGAQADQVQSALPGVYDLGAGDNLFIGTLDGLELAVLGGALDGADLAYLIGALDGADLVQLGGALDGADLAALIGALDGADLVALGGALDGAELVALGGALDGAELAALIGALDVSVVGTTGNDRVQSKLPGTYNLGSGDNFFVGQFDAFELSATRRRPRWHGTVASDRLSGCGRLGCAGGSLGRG